MESFEAFSSVALILALPPTLRLVLSTTSLMVTPLNTTLVSTFFVRSDANKAVMNAVSFRFSLVKIACATPLESVALWPASLQLFAAPTMVPAVVMNCMHSPTTGLLLGLRMVTLMIVLSTPFALRFALTGAILMLFWILSGLSVTSKWTVATVP